MILGEQITAEEVAALENHDELLAWLVRSRHWTTPLHHLATVGADRARALLRGGADLYAADLHAADLHAAGVAAPSPFSLADDVRRTEGSPPPNSAAGLVLRASEFWSPQTHHLFPSEARARAVQLMLLGTRLSRESRFDDIHGSAMGMWDVWMAYVVPHAVERGYEAPRLALRRSARFRGARAPRYR